MDWTELDGWGWTKLAFGLLFTACYAAWFLGARRAEEGPPPEDSGWPAGLSAIGLVLLVLSGSLPLRESLSDGTSLTGALLVLVAIGGKWRRERRRGPGSASA